MHRRSSSFMITSRHLYKVHERVSVVVDIIDSTQPTQCHVENHIHAHRLTPYSTDKTAVSPSQAQFCDLPNAKPFEKHNYFNSPYKLSKSPSPPPTPPRPSFALTVYPAVVGLPAKPSSFNRIAAICCGPLTDAKYASASLSTSPL